MDRDSRQVLTEWLVLSAQAGDEAAFCELHGLWRADLDRFTRSRLGRSEGVDEIASEVWLAIARGLHRLDDPACFPRWAFRITDRRIADWIRRRMRARRREAAISGEAERLTVANAPATDLPDELGRLREAVGRLSVEQQELVHLHYVLERTVAEIAAVLAIPAGTVKSRLFSAREALKQSLERNDP